MLNKTQQARLAYLRSKQAGCEKLPEGPMRDNCEKKKSEGDKKAGQPAEVGSIRDMEKMTGPLTLKSQGEENIYFTDGDGKEWFFKALRPQDEKKVLRYMTAATKTAYFTVVIPPAKAPAKATQWHGPKTLTRGSFKKKQEAHAWAKKNIPGHSYDVKEFADPKKKAGDDAALRSDLIRLAHTNPELRSHLLPLIKQGGCEKKEGGKGDFKTFDSMSMPELEKAVARSFPGSKHNRRQMMLELKDGRMVMFSRIGRGGPSAITEIDIWKDGTPLKEAIKIKSVQDAVRAIKEQARGIMRLSTLAFEN